MPLWHTHPVHTGKKLRTGWHPNQVHIVKKLTTEWVCHLVVILFWNDNRMAWSSGYQLFHNVNRMGCHSILISKSKRGPNPVLIPKSENSSVRRRQRPKPQISYSNQQYHLLIANKLQKLLTYCLFEGLIEEFEEWKQTNVEFVNGCWNDNRMTYSSNCQFFCNVNGWGAIRFSFFCQCEPDRSEGMEVNLVFALLKSIIVISYFVWGCRKRVLGCRKNSSIFRSILIRIRHLLFAPPHFFPRSQIFWNDHFALVIYI